MLRQFFLGKNSVVDFAGSVSSSSSDFSGELELTGPADDEQIDVAGGVGLIFRERSVNPRGLDIADGPERAGAAG